MKELFIQKDELLNLNIRNMGIEEDSKLAHWGKGRRIFLIIHYVLSGKGYFNGKQVKAGEGFIIAPNQMHEYHSSEDDPWTYFFINLSGENAYEICQKHIGEITDGIFTYKFRAKLMDVITETVRSECEISNRVPFSTACALSYFWRIMSLHEENDERDANHYVRDAKNYMRLHFHQHLTISEVAKALNISDRYLYNLFVKYSGCSPKQHLNGLRIARAEKYLSTTDMSISEIATSVGVPDVLAFSRFFKNYTGRAPSEYRRLKKGKSD